MDMVAEAFRTGGIWMYLILLLSVVTLAWLAAMTIIGAVGKRLPAVLWWLGPISVLTAGFAGTGVGLGEALSAVEMVQPERRMAILARGFAFALNTAVFTATASTIFGVLVAVGSGAAGAIGTRKNGGWKLGLPLFIGVVAICSAAVLSGWVVGATEMATISLAIPIVLFCGCVGFVIAGLRYTDDEERANKMAADRYTTGFGALIGVASATVLVMSMGLIEVFEALEGASPENREQLFERGLELVVQDSMVGLAAMLITAIMAVILIAGAGKRAFNRAVWIDAAICIIAFLPALGAFGFAVSKADTFSSAFDETVLSEPADESE